MESYSATFEIKSTATYRIALVIKSKEFTLSGNIDNTDPAYKRIDGIGVADLEAKMILKKSKPMDETSEAQIAANLVNQFTEKSMSMQIYQGFSPFSIAVPVRECWPALSMRTIMISPLFRLLSGWAK